MSHEHDHDGEYAAGIEVPDIAPDIQAADPLAYELSFASLEHGAHCHCAECAVTQQQADLLAKELFGVPEHVTGCQCSECAATQQQADLLAEELFGTSESLGHVEHGAHCHCAECAATQQQADLLAEELFGAPTTRESSDTSQDAARGDDTPAAPSHETTHEDTSLDIPEQAAASMPEAEPAEPDLSPATNHVTQPHETPVSTPDIAPHATPIHSPSERALPVEDRPSQAPEVRTATPSPTTEIPSATASMPTSTVEHIHQTQAAISITETSPPLESDVVGSIHASSPDAPHRIDDILDTLSVVDSPTEPSPSSEEPLSAAPVEYFTDELFQSMPLDSAPDEVVGESTSDTAQDWSPYADLIPVTNAETELSSEQLPPLAEAQHSQLEQLIAAIPISSVDSVLLHELDPTQAEEARSVESILARRLCLLPQEQVAAELNHLQTYLREAQQPTTGEVPALEYPTFRAQVLEPLSRLLDIPVEQLIVLLGIDPEAFEFDPSIHELLHYFVLLCHQTLSSRMTQSTATKKDSGWSHTLVERLGSLATRVLHHSPQGAM